MSASPGSPTASLAEKAGIASDVPTSAALSTVRLAEAMCREPAGAESGTDWSRWSSAALERAVLVAVYHQLAPWWFHVCTEAGVTARLSPSSRERLSDLATRNREQQAARLCHLAEIDAQFRAAGIGYALLKEYAFDGTYPSPACVQQGDLDLLVREEERPAACQRLEHLGYQRVPRPWNNEYRYKRGDGACVDLQSSLQPALGRWADVGLAPADQLNRTRERRMGGLPVPVLDPCDSATFLIAHASLHHNYAPFSKVVHSWNSLVHQRHELTDERLRAVFRAARLENLYDCATWYCETLVGKPWPLATGRTRELPSRLATFRQLMPTPDDYLADGRAAKLARRWQDGWQLTCYPDTFGRRWTCLAHLLLARGRRFLSGRK
ncbi:MAG: nucleotidyltransferase family protein [Pirellulales bacterium]